MKHLVVVVLFLSTLGFADSANAQNPDGDYVVILHGIARSSSHMEDLAEYLQKQGYDVKDVCVMAFSGPHALSRRVFQSAAISAGGLTLSVCVMRLPGFVCLR